MRPVKAEASLQQTLEGIDQAVHDAEAIVARGKQSWDRDRMHRLAGETVVGRLGELAGRLPESVTSQTSEVPWKQVKGIRIVVHHAFHRVDHDLLWETLRRDVPSVGRSLRLWRERERPGADSTIARDPLAGSRVLGG